MSTCWVSNSEGQCRKHWVSTIDFAVAIFRSCEKDFAAELLSLAKVVAAGAWRFWEHMRSGRWCRRQSPLWHDSSISECSCYLPLCFMLHRSVQSISKTLADLHYMIEINSVCLSLEFNFAGGRSQQYHANAIVRLPKIPGSFRTPNACHSWSAAWLQSTNGQGKILDVCKAAAPIKFLCRSNSFWKGIGVAIALGDWCHSCRYSFTMAEVPDVQGQLRKAYMLPSPMIIFPHTNCWRAKALLLYKL